MQNAVKMQALGEENFLMNHGRDCDVCKGYWHRDAYLPRILCQYLESNS